MSYSSPFPPSKKLLKRKKMSEFQSHFLLLLFSHSHQATSNSRNGHRLTLWTTDFIFSSFYGLFFCATHPESQLRFAEGMPIWKCLLIAIASNLKLTAPRSFISNDVINGLNQVQDQSSSYQMGLEPDCCVLVWYHFQATCLRLKWNCFNPFMTKTKKKLALEVKCFWCKNEVCCIRMSSSHLLSVR